MASLRHDLSDRLRRDLGSEAHRVRITSVESVAGTCRIRAALAIDAISAPLEATGPTPELAYAVLIGQLLERVDELRELFERATESCWACGSQRQRGEMASELIGDEMWWLCDRCGQRRDNAARMGVLWPTDFEAWWRHWAALRRVEGRDEAWLADVARQADGLHQVDPRVPNRMAAVLRVAEEG